MDLVGIRGKIKHLRVNDSAHNPSFGGLNDALRTEVIVILDNSDKYFGFNIKPGPHLPSRLAMLTMLRDAYVKDLTIGLGYLVEAGKKACTIIRIDLERE